MTRKLVAATASFAVPLAVAMLAACSRFPVLPEKSAARAAVPPANVTVVAKTPSIALAKSDPIAIAKSISVATVKFVRPAPEKLAAVELLNPLMEDAAAVRATSYGLASYYWHGSSRTANGEKFNPRDMTAAHRTLPFGTRLRVTELKNGRSVTVRINDRGPFIAGRTVDLSQAAAEKLGIVDRGIAKVKIAVLE
jgi:rare lipoprotein A